MVYKTEFEGMSSGTKFMCLYRHSTIKNAFISHYHSLLAVTILYWPLSSINNHSKWLSKLMSVTKFQNVMTMNYYILPLGPNILT
ncbi:hypothetical protein HKD37_05G013367 [Glycine soja]